MEKKSAISVNGTENNVVRGRPRSVNPTAIISQLKQLYPEGTEMSIGELCKASPDIPMKTLMNKSNEYFGMSLSSYLAQEGILSSHKPRKPSIHWSEEQIKKIVDELKRRYFEKEKSSGLKILIAENSDLPLGNINDAIKKYFGETAKDYLVKQGILVDDKENNEDKLAVIERELIERYKGKSKLPQTIAQLKDENSDLCISNIDCLIQKVKGVAAKGYLTELGIIAKYKCPNGKCGINLTWELNQEGGELVISGTGVMTHYVYTKELPWCKYRSKITKVTIEDEVTCIGSKAFYGCTGLTSITIGNSVKRIGDEAFRNCTGLTSITIGNGVTSIGNWAFYGCTGLTSITIGNGVTSIGNDAFYGCTGLTSITIPDSVTSIGYSAFSGCTGLTSITIGNSVTSIGNWAFYGCTGLTSINVTENNSNYCSIDGVLFNKDKTELICYPVGKTDTAYTIPDSVKRIGEFAFKNCTGLTSITIPDSVKRIGDGAFRGCTGLTSITIPDSVTSIGESAFSGCTGLTSINVAENNSNYCSIDGVLFNKDKTELICYPVGKTETSYSIPDSVTSIGQSAFSGCTGLTSITIGNGVTSIGNLAFYGCTGLTSVTIGNGVTSIGEFAFYGCERLKMNIKDKKFILIDFKKDITPLCNYIEKKGGKISKAARITKDNCDIIIYNSNILYKTSNYTSALYQKENNGKMLLTLAEFKEKMKDSEFPDTNKMDEYDFSTDEAKAQSIKRIAGYIKNNHHFQFNEHCLYSCSFEFNNCDSVDFILTDEQIKLLVKSGVPEDILKNLNNKTNVSENEILDVYYNLELSFFELVMIFLVIKYFINPDFSCDFRIYRDKWEERGEYAQMYGFSEVPPELYWKIGKNHKYGFLDMVPVNCDNWDSDY